MRSIFDFLATFKIASDNKAERTAFLDKFEPSVATRILLYMITFHERIVAEFMQDVALDSQWIRS